MVFTRLSLNSPSVLKQGDFSSLISLKMLTNDYADFPGLSQKNATVTLKCADGVAFRKNLIVTDSRIQFVIDEVLAAGVYDVEVTCDGYVFPSSPSVTIEITKSHQNYVDIAALEEVPSMDTINQLIAQNRYDDNELRELLTQLSNREDKDTVYDDSEIKERLTSLETRPEPQLYDDSALRRDITTIKKQLSIRRPPSAWCLDRSTPDNWTIWFDNGCGLVLRDYNKSATIYGYGFKGSTTDDRWDSYPIVQNIIKVARGYITIDKMRSMNSSSWLYFQRNMTILNPVRDKNRYNWDNAFINPNDKGYMPWTQSVVIRTMYELGIWSDEDVVGLGAVLVS